MSCVELLRFSLRRPLAKTFFTIAGARSTTTVVPPQGLGVTQEPWRVSTKGRSIQSSDPCSFGSFVSLPGEVPFHLRIWSYALVSASPRARYASRRPPTFKSPMANAALICV